MQEEFQLRNAVSRAYYALFHVCNAWLVLRNVSERERTRHGNLQQTIGRLRGRVSKSNLLRFYVLREKADYEPSRWKPEDLELAADAVRDMSYEVDEYLAEIQAEAEQARGGI